MSRRFRWPWSDPEPLPPMEGVEAIDELVCEAEKRRGETLDALRRQRRSVHKNHFADDVKKALEATR